MFLAEIPWNQWVITVYLRASGLDHYKVTFRVAGVAGQMFFIYDLLDIYADSTHRLDFKGACALFTEMLTVGTVKFHLFSFSI